MTREKFFLFISAVYLAQPNLYVVDAGYEGEKPI